MTVSGEKIRFKIVNGPNRWDAVLEGLSKGSQFIFSVSFDITNEYGGLASGYVRELKLTILGLHRKFYFEERGCSDSWFIFGACKDDLENMRVGFDLLRRDSKKKQVNFDLSNAIRHLPKKRPVFFIGDYFTHSRTGEIKFILPDLFSNNLDTFFPDYLLSAFQSRRDIIGN